MRLVDERLSRCQKKGGRGGCSIVLFKREVNTWKRCASNEGSANSLAHSETGGIRRGTLYNCKIITTDLFSQFVFSLSFLTMTSCASAEKRKKKTCAAYSPSSCLHRGKRSHLGEDATSVEEKWNEIWHFGCELRLVEVCAKKKRKERKNHPELWKYVSVEGWVTAEETEKKWKKRVNRGQHILCVVLRVSPIRLLNRLRRDFDSDTCIIHDSLHVRVVKTSQRLKKRQTIWGSTSLESLLKLCDCQLNSLRPVYTGAVEPALPFLFPSPWRNSSPERVLGSVRGLK